MATQIGLRFDDNAKSLLLWRKELVESLINTTKPSSTSHKEYVIRLKELIWLLSKCNEEV